MNYYVFKKMWLQLTVAVISNKSFIGMQNAYEKEERRGVTKKCDFRNLVIQLAEIRSINVCESYR